MEEIKDEILYHYTSQKGLLGIINEGGIWASHIAYLNDSTEYNYAVDLLKEEIKAPAAIDPNENQIIRDFFEDSIKFIQSLEASLISVFVCSFSKEKDLLSQWRGYCPNANGFSVGFKKSNLEQIARKNKFELIVCDYNKSKQKNMINGLVNKFIKRIKIEIEKGNKDFVGVSSELAYEFMQLAPKLKDKAFAEEQEWRLTKVLYPKDVRSVREGKSMFIPYTVIKLAEEGERISIDHLIIGPTPHRELSLKSVHALLASIGIKNTKIDVSKIPYRAW